MNILEVQSARKQYRNTIAVNDISLTVPKGSIFGLLGPNGAGKTSLIRMITQITGMDSGSILFDGEQLKPIHTSQIGYMPEERGLYKKMSIGEQLIYLAQLKNLSAKEAKLKLKEWFERFEIEDWWTKKVEDLSKGMQQKVQFISTVLHEPKLLILDEPFSGLDPINATLIRKQIFRLVNEKNISVIFSTHRMEQVEELCEYISLINKGSSILGGPVHELKQTFKKNIFVLSYVGELPSSALEGYELIEQKEQGVKIRLQEHQSTNQLLQNVIPFVNIQQFEEELPSMNDIFIEQVQKQDA